MLNVHRYPAELASLLEPERLPELGPGSPNRAAERALRSLTVEQLGLIRGDMAAAVISGLWLLHDFLDQSHTLSQDIDTPTGSFWHAIMHRREPDPFNSKYWWRRVGKHPVLEQLSGRTSTVGYTWTGPDAFVDFCGKVRGSGSALEMTARRVQRLEWDLLFEWCLTSAGGPSI